MTSKSVRRITPQRAFTAAYKAFIIENRPPAVDWNGTCKYLTADGYKCAIGLCVPDGHPMQSRGGGVSVASFSFPELFPHSIKDIELLSEIQCKLHDNLTTSRTRGWKYSLKKRKKIYEEFAEKHGLKIPKITKKGAKKL